MKPTHLKTLSARIGEIEALYQERKISLPKYRKLILDTIEQLDKIVTLSMFVPCDENGVPMEKPVKSFACNKREAALLRAYKEAQKAVIFEGWTVRARKVIENLKTGDNLAFYSNGNIYYDRSIFHERYGKMFETILLGTNPNLADLAEATTNKTFKFK